ncbi:MAG: hypothetical protein RMK89_14505 [Armatimonadota bacterium]|nr:hypothetical protein [Armatimonadota bacterium]MDW8144656.1 hypothetical protein [Armatimonadota bacterium]
MSVALLVGFIFLAFPAPSNLGSVGTLIITLAGGSISSLLVIIKGHGQSFVRI